MKAGRLVVGSPLQGLPLFAGIGPRALPWAGLNYPFGVAELRNKAIRLSPPRPPCQNRMPKFRRLPGANPTIEA
jgi:hypothetical protein